MLKEHFEKRQKMIMLSTTYVKIVEIQDDHPRASFCEYFSLNI